MTADLTFLVAGLALLLAVVLPELVSRWALSAPIVLVGVGLLIGLTPLPDEMPLDPQDNRAVIEHVTELTVIVALMGVGLALDRPLRLRDRSTWATWSPTWRLLAVADAAVRRRGRPARMGVRAGAGGRLAAWRGARANGSRARVGRAGHGPPDG